MVNIKTKRLTDNQRRILTMLLKKHDAMMILLIEKTKDTSKINAASEKLSTNLDFAKKAFAYWEKLKSACIKQGVYIPIFEEAVKRATSHLEDIIPGQPRDYVRWHINWARCTFFHTLRTDEENVNFEFVPHHPDAPI